MLPEPARLSRPVLFDYRRSSAAYRVRLALALKGVEHDRVAVNLLAGDHRAPAHLARSDSRCRPHGRRGDHRAPAHLARHPQGLVPALAIDGLMLTQSLAILDYLEDTRPTPALLPPDAAGRARVRAIALAVACDIHPLSNLSVLNRIETLAGPDARTAWNRDNIARGLAAIEPMLAAGPPGRFCHGDVPGYADCVLIPQLYNARRWGLDVAHLPRITAFSRACDALPAFAAAHPDAVSPDRT